MEETGITPQRDCKGNDSEEEPKAPCSPFFACGACHGIALPVTGGVAVPQFCGLPLKHLSYYSEPYAYTPPSGIWQPPKMPLSI
jgi:cytochrome c553